MKYPLSGTPPRSRGRLAADAHAGMPRAPVVNLPIHDDSSYAAPFSVIRRWRGL